MEDRKINMKERVEMVRAMDTVIRSLNDEEVVCAWFGCGVADGDYKLSDEDLESYCEDDDDFASLMTFFRKLVGRSEIYCDKVLSK